MKKALSQRMLNESNGLFSQIYGFLNESNEMFRATPNVGLKFKSYDMTMFYKYYKVPWD